MKQGKSDHCLPLYYTHVLMRSDPSHSFVTIGGLHQIQAFNSYVTINNHGNWNLNQLTRPLLHTDMQTVLSQEVTLPVDLMA